LHVIVLVGLLLFAGQQKLSLLFYPAWSIALGLTFYQTHLIATREPEKCFKAFLNNHWFGAAIFVGIILSLS
jgi:4-hydroxybenzoate polyprenyltransferase